LQKQGFAQQEMIDAGVARRRGNGIQDVFRERIMVPFMDTTGHVIGFTGRVLDEAALPKYLNTSQTPLFDKSRFIFGLYQAKEAIRNSGEAVVVEGNLDVLRSYQAGIANVVAISGTAITRQQLKQLSRFAGSITLAFDADAAGMKATERALPLAQEVGVALYIAGLPSDADPDDLIQRDPQEWQRVLDNKMYVMDWLLSLLPSMYDTSTARGKKELTDRAAAVLGRLEDPVEQEHYVHQVADLVGAAPATVMQKIRSGTPRSPRPKQQTGKGPPASSSRDEVETVASAVMALAAAYPDVRSALQELSVEQLPASFRTVAQYLQEHEAELLPEQLPQELQSEADYVKILLLKGEEEYGSWAALDRQVEAFSLVHRLRELQTKRQKQQLSQRIAAAEAAGDYDLRRQLLEEFNQLNG
jgi:DNA primase